MDTKKMKKYLEDIMILESEKYRLEEIKKQIETDKESKEKELNTVRNIDDELNNEKQQEKNRIINVLKTKENEQKTLKFDPSSIIGWFFIFSFGFFIMRIALALTEIEDGPIKGLLGVGIPAIIVYIIYYNIDKKPKAERKQVLEKEITYIKKNLNSELNKIDKEYEEKIKLTKTNDKKNKDNLALLCKNSETQLAELEKIYQQTTSKLNEMYDIDIIFNKYRNLSAVTMFFEYFSSSRVFELEGVNGAYNLYEQELRQNVIINNLSKINDNLEEIKDNQYCMYNEIKNVNSSLQIINQNLIEGFTELAIIETANLAINTEIAKNLKTIKRIQVHDYIMHN